LGSSESVAEDSFLVPFSRQKAIVRCISGAAVVD
jgi:hypothetical protein